VGLDQIDHHTPIIWDLGLNQVPKKVVLNFKNGGFLDPTLRNLLLKLGP
jgi:hypothetical protein